MPKPKKGPRLGGSPAHHDALVASLATELFRHGRIRTTRAKAKAAQPLAERMITFAKRGDIHARRQVLKVIRDKDVVHKLFADIGPAVADRNGGYTRVIKLGPRAGDAAEMVAFELVDAVDGRGGVDLTEEPRRRWSLRRRFGSLSRSAREREETAAEPAAREPVAEPADEEDEEVAAGRITERQLRTDELAEERPGPDVSPEEVEARLGEDEDVESEEPTDDEE